MPPNLHSPTGARRGPSLESDFPAFTLRRSSLVVIGKPVLLAPLTLHWSASGKRSRGCPGNPNPRPHHAAGRDFPKTQNTLSPRKRFFLLDRARPVLFLARPKREWGVHSRRQSRHRPRAASARPLSRARGAKKSLRRGRRTPPSPWDKKIICLRKFFLLFTQTYLIMSSPRFRPCWNP